MTIPRAPVACRSRPHARAAFAASLPRARLARLLGPLLLADAARAAAPAPSAGGALGRRDALAGVLGGGGGLLLAPRLLAPRAVPADVLLPSAAIESIRAGRVAVLPGWLPEEDVRALRADAAALRARGLFRADALAAYGAAKSGSGGAAQFDASRDRTVLPAYFPSTDADGPFVDPSLGDARTRARLGARMDALRRALARGLERPSLAAARAHTHEASYTRYGPGASLARHTDEHHEALKGRRGRRAPSRRSVSWLLYLNEGWDAAQSGGELRVYERAAPPAAGVGAAPAGDLQVGWLRACAADPLERPVFLDDARPAGTCALYTLGGGGKGAEGEGAREYISDDFHAHPVLYVLGGDFFVRQLLMRSRELGARFSVLAQPSPRAAAQAGLPVQSLFAPPGERVVDVPPAAGTLVLFDSVALPHEVLPTRGRERLACSGWFHEQQPAERAARTAAAFAT